MRAELVQIVVGLERSTGILREHPRSWIRSPGWIHRIQVKILPLAQRIMARQINIPAHAQIERKPGGYLEVILGKEVKAFLPGMRILRNPQICVKYRAQHEAGEAIPHIWA